MSTPITIALTAALILGAASAALAKGRGSPGGNVMPCSLDGVNPVFHPQIFGTVAAARTFGFIQAPDRTWHLDRQLCDSPQHRST